MKLSLLSASFFLLIALMTCSGAQKPEGYGVWLTLNSHQTFKDDIDSIKHYKGMLTVSTWSDIEKSEGVFDWKALDAKLEQCAGLGLYSGIGIAVGPLSPRWLYDHGVPKVMTEGHPRKGPYPYYLDSHYIFYVNRMIEEFGRHLRSLPPRMTERLAFVLVMTGSTQDEAPYKGKVRAADSKYAISKSEWLKFRQEVMYTKYNEVFQKAQGTVTPLLFNGLMSWSSEGPEAQEWVKANVKGGWGHKASVGCFYQLNGDGERMDEYLAPIIDRSPGETGLSFSRCEMDQTWQYPIFQSNVRMNFYWTALGALHSGLCIWHPTTTARKWCQESNYWDFIDFFNKYASQTQSPTATRAFCALREGLNAANTKKFPEATYGKAVIDNKDRYLAICAAYAARGAKMDTVETVFGGQSTQRITQSGFNDAGWAITEGNFERFLSQIHPDETSVGWWRVGGEITSESPVSGRFARGFEHAGGKDAMYFDIKDTFFDGKPLHGEYPMTVRVVYYDKGTGQWALQYDAVGDPTKTACVVTKTDTGTWKEKSIILKDANFGNRGPQGADLALVNLDKEDDIFHIVELARGEGQTAP